MSTWAHLHLPRLQAGEVNVISVKVPGQRIEYASWVSLRDARFVVSEAGRQRCIRQGVRNVHAWVVGEEVLRVEDYPWRNDPPAVYRRAVYDPWKGGSFVDSETLEPVDLAACAILSGKNVYYSGLSKS